MKYSLKQTLDLVSVITPVHNASKYLGETIDSVLTQTYRNLEIILIDDASTDSSREIIKKYQELDQRVKSVLLDVNGGVANARNVGIKNAKGRFIAFLDSDDLWKVNKLEEQINFMIENDYEFTFTSYEFIDESSNKLGTVIHTKDKVSYSDLLKYNVIGCLSVIIDRNKIANIEMKHIRHEDYSTWLNILKQGYTAYGLDKNLAYYRTRLNSLSGNKIKSAMWTWNIIRNEEQIPLFKAIYYFIHYALVNIKKRLF